MTGPYPTVVARRKSVRGAFDDALTCPRDMRLHRTNVRLTSHSHSRTTFGVALFAATLLAATFASAQITPLDTARRRGLVDQAVAASNRGEHALALQLAEDARRIQVTPSLLAFVAEQHEALSEGPGAGRHLLDAVLTAADCVRTATAQPAATSRDQVLSHCTDVLSRLNARVARVRINVTRPFPNGMTIRVNGQHLPETEWGTSIPLLPGDATVDATSPERPPLHVARHLVAGSNETVEVRFEAPPRANSVPNTVLPPDLTTPPPESSSSRTIVRVLGAGLLGLGVLSGGVAFVQWLGANSQASDSLNGNGDQGAAWARYDNDINPQRRLSVSDVCARASSDASNNPDAAITNNLCDSNATARTLYYAFGISGLALAAAGITLLVVPMHSESPPRVSVVPMLGPGVRGGYLEARF